MKRRVLILGVVAIACVGYFVLTRPQMPALMDERCPTSARYPIALGVDDLSRLRHAEYIAVIDAEGNMERVTKDDDSFQPSFSPDGAKLAFVKGDYYDDSTGWIASSIETMNVDGTGRRRLTDGKHMDLEPQWSPDGDMIAFTRTRTGVMVVPAEGGEPRIVVPEREGVGGANDRPHLPQWSADGDRIAYLAGGDVGIYIVDRQGGPATTVASDLGGPDAFAWSPDGETFAFGGISTVTRDVPNPRDFADGAVGDFSPDGRHLMYVASDPGDERLLVQPMNGGGASEIAFKLPNDHSLGGNVDWLDCR